MATKRPTPAQQQKLVDKWNEKYPCGGVPIRYWPGPVGVGEPKTGFTVSNAAMMGGHTATIYLDCVSGGVALDHVEAV